MAEGRATVTEEKAATIMMVMEAVKKEATESIKRYKASTEFEEEVREAVCYAFIKGFEECWHCSSTSQIYRTSSRSSSRGMRAM